MCQKHLTDSQKPKRREHKNETHQTTKGKTIFFFLKSNKEETKNYLENKVSKGNKYTPISNYLKCQWIKCSN